MTDVRLPTPLVCLVLGCVFLLGADSCKTTVPESDDTPPKVNLFIADDGSEKVTSDKEITLGDAPDLSIGATASDDGGVQSLTLRVTKLEQCNDGVLPTRGEIQDVDDVKSEESESVGVGDETEEERIVSYKITADKMQVDNCSDNPSGVQYQFKAIAENFHGGKAESSLLKVFSPGYQKR